METIGYILAGVTLVWLWTEHVWPMISMKKVSLGYKYRNKLMEKLDRKPINCAVCLCFYTSIALFYCLGDIYFISLPLVYNLIHKHTL